MMSINHSVTLQCALAGGRHPVWLLRQELASESGVADVFFLHTSPPAVVYSAVSDAHQPACISCFCLSVQSSYFEKAGDSPVVSEMVVLMCKQGGQQHGQAGRLEEQSAPSRLLPLAAEFELKLQVMSLVEFAAAAAAAAATFCLCVHLPPWSVLCCSVCDSQGKKASPKMGFISAQEDGGGKCPFWQAHAAMKGSVFQVEVLSQTAKALQAEDNIAHQVSVLREAFAVLQNTKKVGRCAP
eukprot:1160382-Pelagomonas_calceolata.AAC.13